MFSPLGHEGCHRAALNAFTTRDANRFLEGLITKRTDLEVIAPVSHVDRINTYDFSAGSSRYKLSWSDDIIQLHDVIKGMTTAGAAYVACIRGRSAAKRYIKENDTLLRAASGLRRMLRGQTPVKPISD